MGLFSVHCVPSAGLGTVKSREVQKKEGLFWKLCRGEVGAVKRKWSTVEVTLEPHFLVELGLSQENVSLKEWSSWDVS